MTSATPCARTSDFSGGQRDRKSNRKYHAVYITDKGLTRRRDRFKTDRMTTAFWLFNSLFLARVIRHLSPSRPQHSFSPGVSTGRFRLIESGSFEISRISQVENVQFWSWQAAYRQPLVVRRVTQRCASHLWYRREKQLITSCLFVQFNNRVVVTRCPSRGHFYNTFHRRLGDQVSDKRRNIERRRRST